MDATYFGRDWSVIVLKDFVTGKISCRKYIKQERLADYRECTDFILSKGYQISGIVCDGFKGISGNILPVRSRCASIIL
jgi:hypothetical protein